MSVSPMLNYVLKIKDALGKLVQPDGLRTTYRELHGALRDAEVLRDVFGETIYVTQSTPEKVVAFV